MIKHGWHLTDEEIARQYRSVASRRRYDLTYVHSLITRLIQRHIRFGGTFPESARVLDAGCGTGLLIESLCKGFPSWAIEGIDPSYSPDSLPRPIASNGTVRHGSVYRVDADDGSFDLIVLSEVIEHLNRPDRALHEVRRLLNPKGVAIVSVPNASAYIGWRILERLLPFEGAYKRLLPAEHPKRTWQPIDTLYEYREILELIDRNGFKVADKLSGQFIPPFLYGAPLVGRVYRKYNFDAFCRTMLPAHLGYRLVLALQKAIVD